MENASSEAQFSHLCVAVISTREKESVRATWSRSRGSVLHLLGCRAGSKSLYAVQGLVDIYIFSENTTFKWNSWAACTVVRALFNIPLGIMMELDHFKIW